MLIPHTRRDFPLFNRAPNAPNQTYPMNGFTGYTRRSYWFLPTNYLISFMKPEEDRQFEYLCAAGLYGLGSTHLYSVHETIQTILIKIGAAC